MKFRSLTIGAVGLVLGLSVAGGAAVAGDLITGKDIKNHTIQQRDLAPGLKAKVNRTGTAGTAGAQGPAGPAGADGKPGAAGAQGPKGASGLEGAIYRVTEYANGGGGSATTACADTNEESMKYVAIAGGVQGSRSGVTEKQDGFLVSSSFPGRMDWSTGTPKPGRLDGWIVFGNSQHTDTLRVWALCVPAGSFGAASSVDTQTVTIDN